MLKLVTTQIDVEKVRESIGFDISNTSHWRSEKSVEYPYDSRNREAVARLDTLEESVKDIPKDLLIGFSQAWTEREDATVVSEMWSETLRQIGFYSGYKSASELIESFLSDVSRTAS